MTMRAPGALPTLTEVIELDVASAAPAAAMRPPAEALPMDSDTAALMSAVLGALDSRLEALLEARLHAALSPQLRLLVQEAIRQVRGEMAVSLQALVAQAVSEALARRQKP